MEFEYINHIKKLISLIEESEADNIIEAFIYSLKPFLIKTVSTSLEPLTGILSEELFYRAGGLMLVTPIFGRELMLDNSPITLTSKMEQCVAYEAS
ncbi:MAG: hypothetical protein ACLRQX_06950 [Turicibacter sanguinis]